MILEKLNFDLLYQCDVTTWENKGRNVFVKVPKPHNEFTIWIKNLVDFNNV